MPDGTGGDVKARSRRVIMVTAMVLITDLITAMIGISDLIMIIDAAQGRSLPPSGTPPEH